MFNKYASIIVNFFSIVDFFLFKWRFNLFEYKYFVVVAVLFEVGSLYIIQLEKIKQYEFLIKYYLKIYILYEL
jgi:hypothetical protein